MLSAKKDRQRDLHSFLCLRIGGSAALHRRAAPRGARRLGTALLGTVLMIGTAAAQGLTERVSVDSSGGQTKKRNSTTGDLSANGQIVAFFSSAADLVPNDTNGGNDVFVHDRLTGITERVSVDSSGAEVDSGSDSPKLSADGQIVVFRSFAATLVANDTNGVYDIFVHDRSTGITERVSVSSSGAEANARSYFPNISADGRFVIFTSDATNLVTNDTNGLIDVFVHDRLTGVTERVNVDSSGAQADGRSEEGVAISTDGRFVAFDSDATNLVPNDTNGTVDVFIHDRSTGITERVSVDSSGLEANHGAGRPAISADGALVAFQSDSTNLVSNDTNGKGDVFVHDRSTGITERVSVNSSGVEGDDLSIITDISANGNIVLFTSWASNLVAGGTGLDLYVHDRTTGITERVSVDSSGAAGNNASAIGALADDGNTAAFVSWATNLVPNDTNGLTDVFVHDRCAIDALWANYGAGLAGTLGIPSLTASADPVLGTTITIDVGNSLGAATTGFMCAGFSRDAVSFKGGTLLVGNLFLVMVLPLTPAGFSLDADLPDDSSLCGLVVDAQVLELDAGARRGVSFTPGLELVLGH